MNARLRSVPYLLSEECPLSLRETEGTRKYPLSAFLLCAASAKSLVNELEQLDYIVNEVVTDCPPSV